MEGQGERVARSDLMHRFPSRLHQAALAGDKLRVRRILLHEGENLPVGAETKRLCVHLAITSLDQTLLNAVLASGYDITESLNRQDDNALHLTFRSPCPDLSITRRILQEMGPEGIDNRNLNGETALHIAATRSQVEPAAALLSAGASINAEDTNGDTPLHKAIRSEHIRMICLLLVYRANLMCENHQLDSPITIAAKKKQLHILRLLLKQNFNGNKRIQAALTKCLVDAVLKGDSELVYLMLKKGATVDGLMRGKDTVLHIAASRGDAALVQLLVAAGGNVNTVADGVMALHCAAQRGHTEVVKILLENGAEVDLPLDEPSLGMTSIHLATAGNHPSVVDLLLSYGAKVNAQDGSGNTPLHTAASLPELSSNESQEMMSTLLEAGGDTSQRNHSNDMPHHIAAHRGHLIKLEHLLRTGCQLEACDGYGDTALTSALINHRLQLIAMLLAHGAKTQVLVDELDRIAHLDAQSVFIYTTVIHSGNTSDEDEESLRGKLAKVGSKGKPTTQVLKDLSKSSCVNLKSLTRKYIRRYLMGMTSEKSLYESVDCLPLPPLIKRYILLKDFIDASVSM